MLNTRTMKRIFTTRTENFVKYGDVLLDNHDGLLILQDNGADILGIAHLDSVPNTDHFAIVKSRGREYVLSGQIDNRLGVYTLLELLPSLNITMDILLTDNEETGRSTAKYFATTKNYKWMVQFDRRGDDVVHYMYGSPRLKKRLNRSGFHKINHGAASDICKLQHLGCEGFNVGVGYINEHDDWARADLTTYQEQMVKFSTFYTKFQFTEFPFDTKQPFNGSYSWSNNTKTTYPPAIKQTQSLLEVVDDEDEKCVICTKAVELDSLFHDLCKKCEKEWKPCQNCHVIYNRDELDASTQYCKKCLGGLGGQLVAGVKCLNCKATLFQYEIDNYNGMCSVCAPISARSGYGLL